VDHTHADSVVTVTNTPDGKKYIRDIYGGKVLVIPYVMPGFILAKYIYKLTRDLDWPKVEGIILLNHGIFTFADDAKTSYESMIRLVSRAERFLKTKTRIASVSSSAQLVNLTDLAKIRREVSLSRGQSVVAILDGNPDQVRFSSREDIRSVSQRGPLTPDHVIRPKPKPVVIGEDITAGIKRYVQQYRKYFRRNTKKGLVCLEPSPQWALWPGRGTIAFGRSLKDARIVADITAHTTRAIERAQALGGWSVLSEHDIFEMEYWVLEQAKLAKKDHEPVLQGKIALVTGAAGGIGRACVETFLAQGAVVAALDIKDEVEDMFAAPDVLGLKADVTDHSQLRAAVEATVRRFGGLDIVVANAGIFPPSERLEAIQDAAWAKSMRVNLESSQKLLKFAIPFLKLGNDPSVVLIASKNVPAPGPGAGAYSVAKAGLTQLGRVAALELAEHNIRVNILHPNAVFDTAIWTRDVLRTRAKSYGLSVADYKRSNLLKTEVTSADVAALAAALASPLFAKTTGAQIPVDGGNERVI
ncbi:MAG: bifunctional aldolase/short-chain dehydrogenase, partial [Candidatus Omnitrophica bacterium CG12_big_fil_rev_8_21_14_0_65_50_5]